MKKESDAYSPSLAIAVALAPKGIHTLGILEPLGRQLYARRYYGLAVLIAFNIFSSVQWLLFAAVASDTAKYFDISLTQVNWLANSVGVVYLFAGPLVPLLVKKTTIPITCCVAVVMAFTGALLRCIISIEKFHKSSSTYPILVLSSVFVGIAQAIFQTVPPAYSEIWFGVNGRTSATMLCAVANPFGGAVAQLLSPAIVTPSSQKITTLCLIPVGVFTVGGLAVWIIGVAPPTPPTLSAEENKRLEDPVMLTLARLLGIRPTRAEFKARERVDFWIISFLFSIIVGFFVSFMTLTNQLFEPYGYSSDVAGYIGAAIIISGLISAITVTPVLERYFPLNLARAAKALVPIIGICMLSLIWAVKPNSLGPILVLAIVLGAAGFIMLPVGLELAAEVAHSITEPTTTSAILYWGANAVSVVVIVVMGSVLKAGDDANPPYNMHRALIFQGATVAAASVIIFALKGDQTRSVKDRQEISGVRNPVVT